MYVFTMCDTFWWILLSSGCSRCSRAIYVNYTVLQTLRYTDIKNWLLSNFICMYLCTSSCAHKRQTCFIVFILSRLRYANISYLFRLVAFYIKFINIQKQLARIYQNIYVYVHKFSSLAKNLLSSMFLQLLFIAISVLFSNTLKFYFSIQKLLICCMLLYIWVGW